MKRIIAFVSAMLMLFAALPAVAEEAMPQQVQTFFESMGDVLTLDQVTCAEDQVAYVNGMPGALLSFTLSRMQYDRFYHYSLDEKTGVTVCCLDGKPLAYILDFNAMDYIGYNEAVHNLLMAFPKAYQAAYPRQEGSMDIYTLMPEEMLQSIFNPMENVFLSDVQDHGQTLVSSHIFAIGGQMAMQLFPKDAYEGVTIEGEELTAELNHDLSAALAMNTEYQLMMKSLE